MGNREPLTQEEKERIYEGKLSGQSLSQLAAALSCSVETARKWWRRGRQSGLEGLRKRRTGRKASGPLSQFDSGVAEKAKVCKHQHPGWGPNRVLIELGKDPDLRGLRLPKRSRLAAFFKACCPEDVSTPRRQPSTRPPVPHATAVHEVWQMDNQEDIHLQNGERAVICNIRDPYGAAPIASQAFSSQAKQRSRKLEVAEFRQVLRSAFREWQTLPDSLSTDNELRLIGNPSSDFPSLLTLYLVGLGIKHVFTRPSRPTDHAQVERGHRTLDNLALNEQALQNVEQLQKALDRERQVYLLEFPCLASDCHGRPPLVAHPELLHPRRYYQPELELQLFSIQRVFDYLATFTFERKLSASGCVSLTHQVSIGRHFARELSQRVVWVRCDPLTHEWVFYTKPERASDPLAELARRPIQRITVETLTGLSLTAPHTPQPVQLTLPFFVSS